MATLSTGDAPAELGTAGFILPGNPVSTTVTIVQFVRPALLNTMEHNGVVRRTVPGFLKGAVHKKLGKLSFLKVQSPSKRGATCRHLGGPEHRETLDHT